MLQANLHLFFQPVASIFLDATWTSCRWRIYLNFQPEIPIIFKWASGGTFRTIFGFGWGSPPPKRSSAAFDRGSQTGPPRSNPFFFGAVNPMGAVDGTGDADDRPTTRSKEYLRRLQNAVVKFLTAM